MHRMRPTPQVVPLPLYPGSERDWTVTLHRHIPVSTLLQAIQAFQAPLLERAELLDIYQSDQLGHDKQNLTFRFYYRDLAKTVSLEEVEATHARLISSLAKKLHDHLV